MLKKIADSLSFVLVNEFSNFTQYFDEIVQDFKRPSFFISLVDTDEQVLNKNMVKKLYYFQLKVFLDKNQRGNSETFEEYEVIERLDNIFVKGLIDLYETDRKIKIEKKTSTKINGDITLMLDLSLVIDRSESFAEDYDLMQDIKFRRY